MEYIVPIGWKCPVCGKVYAPFVPECTNCGGQSILNQEQIKTITGIGVDYAPEDSKTVYIKTHGDAYGNEG